MFKFQWNSGALLTMGWTDSEELLCVQEDGVILIYDMFGHYQHKFSMGQEANDSRIIDAKIYPTLQGTGLAIMTTNFRIFIVNNVKEPKVRLLPEMPSMLKNCIKLPVNYKLFYCRISFGSNQLGCDV